MFAGGTVVQAKILTNGPYSAPISALILFKVPYLVRSSDDIISLSNNQP